MARHRPAQRPGAAAADEGSSRRWAWVLAIALGLPLLAVMQPLIAITGLSEATASAAAACGTIAAPGTATPPGAGAVPAAGPAAGGGGALAPERIAQLAAHAGFTGEDVVTAVAVALAESGGRPGINNAGMNRNGTVDHGLWQINSVHTATGFDVARAYDAAYNATWARRVFTNAGSRWTPWVTYNTGAYQDHLPAARQGAAGVVPAAPGAGAASEAPTGGPQPSLVDCGPAQVAGTPVVTDSAAAAAAIAFAQQQLGEPYVWGATGPGTWDCSGLVQAAWRAAGVGLPRVARDQARAVTPVRREQVQPGDLIFYGDPVVYHVVMYLGNGRIIEAPRSGLTVRETAVRWSNFVGAGRPGGGAPDAAL